MKPSIRAPPNILDRIWKEKQAMKHQERVMSMRASVIAKHNP